MKKTILTAFCLSLVVTSANLMAATQTKTIITASTPSDGRQIVKQEELPDPVKKVLASDTYKGWNVKEAALITPTPGQPAAPAQVSKGAAATTTTQAAANATAASTIAPAATTTSYYEITLTKDKETNIVKFQKDGTVIK